jgi:hypothetical protein
LYHAQERRQIDLVGFVWPGTIHVMPVGLPGHSASAFVNGINIDSPADNLPKCQPVAAGSSPAPLKDQIILLAEPAD